MQSSVGPWIGLSASSPTLCRLAWPAPARSASNGARLSLPPVASEWGALSRASSPALQTADASTGGRTTPLHAGERRSVPIDRGDQEMAARCGATCTARVQPPAIDPAGVPVRTPGLPANVRERRYRPAWARESRGRRGFVPGDTRRPDCASHTRAKLLPAPRSGWRSPQPPRRVHPQAGTETDHWPGTFSAEWRSPAVWRRSCCRAVCDPTHAMPSGRQRRRRLCGFSEGATLHRAFDPAQVHIFHSSAHAQALA
jgi:hypothetical protein